MQFLPFFKQRRPRFYCTIDSTLYMLYVKHINIYIEVEMLNVFIFAQKEIKHGKRRESLAFLDVKEKSAKNKRLAAHPRCKYYYMLRNKNFSRTGMAY